ncbi:MAG: hypothetical protein ACM339_13360 [Ignavibacteria bacterium]
MGYPDKISLIIFCLLLFGCKPEDSFQSEAEQLEIRPINLNIEPIIDLAVPYNQISELKGKIPGDFFKSKDANTLIQWIKQGFYLHKNINDPERIQFFYGLDLAALASDTLKFFPLYELKKESEINILTDLINSKPAENLTAYKMYNEGVILRSADICIGIDIVLSPENKDIPRLYAEFLDGLLVTHSDWDHYDNQSTFISELKRRNKPVILPADNKSLPLGGILDSGKIKEFEWTAFKGGHLDLKFTSLYLVKIRNWKVLHSGDNTAWLNFGNSDYARGIDIFFFKPESIELPIEKALEKIHSKIVIPHHLLELGHELWAISHDTGIRVIEQAKNNSQVIMLQWGEKLSLPAPFSEFAYFPE